MALAQAAKKSQEAPPAPQLVSMSPDDFTSGGLIDDIDVTFTEVAACVFDYQGNSDPNTPTLAIEMTDANGAHHAQYYSVGKVEDWAPSEDGRGFISKSGKISINDSTNLGMLIQSAVEQGLPKELLARGDLKAAFEGLKCHVLAREMERKGLVRTGKNADRPPRVLLISKIYELPGSKGGKVATMPAKATAGKGTAGKATPAASGKANGSAESVASDMDGTIIAALQAALMEKGEALPKKEIPKVVFAAFSTPELQATRSQAMARSNDAKFLDSLSEHGMVFADGQLALE